MHENQLYQLGELLVLKDKRLDDVPEIALPRNVPKPRPALASADVQRRKGVLESEKSPSMETQSRERTNNKSMKAV